MKRGSLSHERGCCLPQPSETKAPLANSPELGQCSHPSPGGWSPAHPCRFLSTSGSGSCCLREQFQHLPQARRKRTWAPYQSFCCLASLSGHTEVRDWPQVRGSSERNLLSHGWDALSGAWSRTHLQRKHLWVQRKNLILINLRFLSQATL